MPIIEFDNVRYSYGEGGNALDGLTLSVEEGTFVCVLGGNGSGKSTFAKHVNALLVPDSGEVRVLGCATGDPANTFAVRSSVGMVFQNPDDQIVASIVEDDVAFGPENLGIPPAEIRSRVMRALGRVGLAGFERREVDTLSGGQKQRVAIAGALAMEPRVLVLDEAGSMLDPAGRCELMRTCRELNADGMTIVMITHFMSEAASADRVIVLEGGRVALDGAPQDVLTRAEELRRLQLDVPFPVQMCRSLRRCGLDVRDCIDLPSLVAEIGSTATPGARGMDCNAGGSAATGAASADRNESGSSDTTSAGGVDRITGDNSATLGAGRPERAQPATSTGATEPLLAFEGVTFSYEQTAKPKRGVRRTAKRGANALEPQHHALHDLTFELREGELLGIAGRTGSGKSTLIQLCNGLLQPTAGRVLVRGRSLADKQAAASARRQIGVVFQYPEHQLFASTVYEDVAFGPRNLGCSEPEVEQRVRRALASVHLDFDALRDRSPFALSGGQQRRVAFAGVLAMEPDALLLDEPVAGLDPQSHGEFLSLIGELHRERGITCAIVSHDMDDLAATCDRVMLLDGGNMLALDTPARVFAHAGRLEEIGLAAPSVLQLAGALGIELSHVPAADELAGTIANARR